MQVLFQYDRGLRSLRQVISGMLLAGVLSSVCILVSVQNITAKENISDTVASNEAAEVETLRLKIYPKAESKPALKTKFVLDPTEQIDGNAAIFYLKAMGFFERDPARAQIREAYKQMGEQAKAAGKEQEEFPPYSYLEMRPADYPKAEVASYLELSSFQEPILREAKRLRNFSMDRNIHLSDNPIGYLLPEIQNMRELARTQRIRCRLAIAENRIDDAIEIISQQMTMSRHLGMDDFLVCYLVGSATLSMAIEDSLMLREHPDCPNLYWAFAQLPSPLIDTQRCLAFEHQFAFFQIPRLKEINTTPKSSDYWKDFIIEFSRQTADIEQYADSTTKRFISQVQGEKRVESIQKSVEENVPKAKQYLLDRGILTADALESFPREQAVFLAMKDYYEVAGDDNFKWLNLPYDAVRGRFDQIKKQLDEDGEKLGWFTNLHYIFWPASESILEAKTRMLQQLAASQVIEAIRMAGASNGGKLIESLEQAPVPVPNDPFTAKAFSYEVTGDVAVLSSKYPISKPFRIELQFAK